MAKYARRSTTRRLDQSTNIRFQCKYNIKRTAVTFADFVDNYQWIIIGGNRRGFFSLTVVIRLREKNFKKNV